MTIKYIKETYKGKYGRGENTRFVTYNYGDEIGKVVIVLTWCKDYGYTVWQAVRVKDGAELIADGCCRPCDDLYDAVDVAEEMF